MNIEAKELSKIYGSGESRVVAMEKTYTVSTTKLCLLFVASVSVSSSSSLTCFPS